MAQRGLPGEGSSPELHHEKRWVFPPLIRSRRDAVLKPSPQLNMDLKKQGWKRRVEDQHFITMAMQMFSSSMTKHLYLIFLLEGFCHRGLHVLGPGATTHVADCRDIIFHPLFTGGLTKGEEGSPHIRAPTRSLPKITWILWTGKWGQTPQKTLLCTRFEDKNRRCKAGISNCTPQGLLSCTS